MASIEQAFTEKLRRIAKKEVGAAVAPLLSKISEMKKALSAQAKLIKELKSTMPKAKKEAEVIPTIPEDKDVRINAKGVKKVRAKLDVSQKQFADLIGASLLSVSHWELGKSAPREVFKRKIAALRKLGKRELIKIFEEKNISFEKAKRGRKPMKKDGEALSAAKKSVKKSVKSIAKKVLEKAESATAPAPIEATPVAPADSTEQK